jgi:hypothetical protein
MSNNNLTDERIASLVNGSDGWGNFAHCDYADIACALRELQERRKADENCFMYGIVDPDGRAYLDEFCVSSDRGLMEDEAAALNDTHDTTGYRAVALYTALPLTDSERTELQEYRNTYQWRKQLNDNE